LVKKNLKLLLLTRSTDLIFPLHSLSEVGHSQ